MQIETLDQKIRAKALEDLTKEVLQALLPLKRLVPNDTKTGLKSPSGEPIIWFPHILDAIEKATISNLRSYREDQAIEEFIHRVNSLQDQVNDLAQLRQSE